MCFTIGNHYVVVIGSVNEVMSAYGRGCDGYIIAAIICAVALYYACIGKVLSKCEFNSRSIEEGV
jgi:hypothetical protein